MDLSRIKGYALAALAAAAYGTNPAFAIPLYEQGMNPNSVLLFRYLLGLPMLALIMAIRHVGFSLKRSELGATAILGLLMSVSSLTLFESYNHMNSGVASTLLFVYPIMVALIMVFCYHEKFSSSIALCLITMVSGLAMLMRTSDGASLSGIGCMLVMASALTYALYIVYVNVSERVRAIPTTKLLFYVLAWGCVVYLLNAALSAPLTVPEHRPGWINLVALAFVPTVISLSCTTRAIQLIGSTPTAILGALEPVSAVVLSIIVLDQSIGMREIAGGLLIVLATSIVIADKTVDKAILHVRKMFPLRRHRTH